MRPIVLKLFLLLLIFQNHFYGKTISFVSDPWMPLTGDKDSSQRGYLVDIVTEIFQSKGYEVDYEVMPWTRAIEEVRKGKKDAILGAYKEDVPDFVFPQMDMGIIEDTFFVLKGNSWRYQGLESLKKIRLGCVNGYKYGTEFDRYIKESKRDSLRVQEISGEDPLYQNLLKLKNQRVDVILDAKIVVHYMNRNRKLNLPLEEVGSLGLHRVYAAFSPRNSQTLRFMKEFDEGIRELRASGRVKEILSTYQLSDWMP